MIKDCKKHGLTEHSKRADGYYRCKKCSVEAVSNWRRNLKKKAVEYKGGKCIYCEYNKYIGALEFHHPNGKDFGLGQAGTNPRSWKKVKEELDKCDLVCKNCHAEIHYDMGV